MKTKVCEQCKVEFKVPPTWPKQKFCSNRCKHIGIRYRPQPYTVETKCTCGCGSIILNPDDHYRYRKFLPEHRNSGGTHPRLGYKEEDKHVESRINAMKASFRKRKPTCIERKLYEYLDSTGTEYLKQKQIGRYIPDAFIPELNLCIFVDGRYWHSRPANIERDRKANKSLMEKGYKVIRLLTKDLGYIIDLEPLKYCLPSS